MSSKEELQQHYNNVYTVIRDTFGRAREVLSQEEFPNMMLVNETLIFNMIIKLDDHDFVMNFVVYQVTDVEYMLELTTYFKQENKCYPEGYPEDDAQFIIMGAPLLGANEVKKPLGCNNLYEARLLSLDYVDEHLPSIIQESLGASDLL